MKIIPLTKLRVISRRDYDQKLEKLGISPRKSTKVYRSHFLYVMAQSARESRKTLLSIEPFREGATSDAPIQ